MKLNPLKDSLLFRLIDLFWLYYNCNMRIVAVRFTLGLLAATKRHHHIIICHIFDWLKTRSFMRTITKWLRLTATTRAPPVSFIFLNNNTKWPFFSNYCFFAPLEYPLTLIIMFDIFLHFIIIHYKIIANILNNTTAVLKAKFYIGFNGS